MQELNAQELNQVSGAGFKIPFFSDAANKAKDTAKDATSKIPNPIDKIEETKQKASFTKDLLSFVTLGFSLFKRAFRL